MSWRRMIPSRSFRPRVLTVECRQPAAFQSEPARHTLSVPQKKGAASRPAPAAEPAPDDAQFFTSISCAVFAAGRYTFPPNWRLNPGSIPHYRLFVATGGQASFVVGATSYTLSAGSVILVPPNTTHRARHDPASPLTAYVIDFEAKLHGILDVAEFCGLP